MDQGEQKECKDMARLIMSAMTTLEIKFWQVHKSASSDARRNRLHANLVLLRANLTEIQNEAQPEDHQSLGPKKSESIEVEMDTLFAQVQHLAITDKMADKDHKAVLLALTAFTERLPLLQ